MLQNTVQNSPFTINTNYSAYSNICSNYVAGPQLIVRQKARPFSQLLNPVDLTMVVATILYLLWTTFIYLSVEIQKYPLFCAVDEFLDSIL